MATPLDLQEQEQLDQIKAFWQQYGNLITWTLILALGVFSAWNAWNWYQRDQGAKAGALYDELDRAVAAGQLEKTQQAFTDIKDRFGKTAYAQQAGLVVSKLFFEKGQPNVAMEALSWVAANGIEDEYRVLARLRASSLLLEQKKFDEALAMLDAAPAVPSFKPLVDDRRGDILGAKGQPAEAIKAYRAAWDGMPKTVEYRRMIEAKLVALGAAPVTEAK